MTNQNIDDIFIVRNVRIEDLNYIYDTWLNGLYFGNETFRLMREHIFKQNYQKVLEALIPNTVIKVCALKDDIDTIIGYAVYRDTALDWVFVKPMWRRIGIAKKLVPEKIKTYSHITKMVKSYRPKTWEFNPFI
jgi:GNAT superfamily N-acetyltransferase